MLAATREKRANAGNRMSSLLENEETDDFYSNAYGGFADEADDREYSEEEEEESNTDSDISIDENDEPLSDQGDEEEKITRRHRVITKAYKEPQKPKIIKLKASSKPVSKVSADVDSVFEKKKMRDSTTKKSLETKQRTQANDKLKDQLKKKPTQHCILTQEQLLEEAKITEMQNLKSLEMFQRLELEKKKTRVMKPKITEPMIRYHSVSMPLIEEIDDENGNTEHGEEENKVVGLCSRNFITFPDENTMKEHFNYKKPTPSAKNNCIVTRLPAKYFDPLTKQPCANLSAFRIVREAYYSQVEKRVDSRLPEVAKWLEWRKQVKASRHIPRAVKVAR